jgi:hypothetical protein
MGCARLSTTTAPGTPPRSGARLRLERLRAPARAATSPVSVAGALVAAALLVAGLLFLACTDAPTVTHTGLTPGTPATADLDGDGSPEQILVSATDFSLSITDGTVAYRSRDKWRVFQALLADADRDGLTEVVALLDSQKGRHLGLFAYYGGEYRERLVTQVITPAPISIEVVDYGQLVTGGGTDGNAGTGAGDSPAASKGDVIVLLQQPAAGETAPVRILLRWNGFSFTRIEAGIDQ